MTTDRMPTGTTGGTPQVLLTHHLKQLKLPTVLREYEKVARECARDGIDHPRYLLRLIELELIDRERLTGALLDRLTHHVSILTMNGDSYRLKQSSGRRSARRAEQNQATVSAASDTGGIPPP